MRIAVFSNTYLPTVSGVVRSISSYKAALEELGHEVHVFTQGARGYRDQESNIHRYFSFHPGLPNNLPVTVPFSHTMDRVLSELQPDVIHSQHPILLGDLARQKARQLGVPLVYTLHAQYWHYGMYIPIKFLRRPYNNFIGGQVKRYLRGCDHIIAPSESMLNLILGKFQTKKPITVIPTGVDLKSYERTNREKLRTRWGWSDDFVIITTGRLAPEKNWLDLIQAAGEVIKNNSRAKLVFLGDGPDRRVLARQAEELGIGNKVEFVGMVPYEEVAHYLVAADLFAFTSLTETQGLVTLEALAAGLPVVAYDAIGTRDIVEDGENGALTPVNNAALANAITRLMQDPVKLEQLKKGALRTAQQMDIHVLAKELLAVYETAIQASR